MTRRITDEIGHDVVVLGLHRHELERLPLDVLREAVANAVAHRVYEDGRRAVRVAVRPSRVTITSPGPLPEPVTVETMRDQDVARNVTVIAALRRFRLAEDAGRGVDLMQDVMAQQLLDPPQFSADESAVTVTLPLTSTVTTAERAWIGELQTRGELRGPDRALLLQAARGRTLTNSTARELLGLDSTHARAALQRLRDAGFLRQEGDRSGARYLLAPTLAPPAGLRMSQADLRTVEDLAAEQPVTNALVRERLGLDRVEALRLLTGLVAEGRLVREGERRGVRYLLPNQKGRPPAPQVTRRTPDERDGQGDLLRAADLLRHHQRGAVRAARSGAPRRVWALTGFQPVTAAMVLRSCSTWAALWPIT